MLEPPIRNFGVAGIRRSAKRISNWADVMDTEALKWTLFMYSFMSPVGGTGGGLFRYMFSRSLQEAAAITGQEDVNIRADAFRHIGAAWEELGNRAKATSELEDAKAHLQACVPIECLAELEQEAWQSLSEQVTA